MSFKVVSKNIQWLTLTCWCPGVCFNFCNSQSAQPCTEVQNIWKLSDRRLVYIVNKKVPKVSKVYSWIWCHFSPLVLLIRSYQETRLIYFEQKQNSKCSVEHSSVFVHVNLFLFLLFKWYWTSGGQINHIHSSHWNGFSNWVALLLNCA